MSLREQLMDDLKEATRQHDERRKLTIRSIIAAIKNAETELDSAGQRFRLDNDDVEAVIRRQVKQRQDSIAVYRSAGRNDLVAEEESELAILRAYLPQQLTQEEIAAQARLVIAQVGASQISDIGKVMKPLLALLGDKADGRLVNKVVRELLAG